MADSNKYTEAERRKRRIKRYKKMIVLFLLFLILLPTVFCVILFVRVGKLQKQLNTLMAVRLTREDQEPENGNPAYVYAQEPEGDGGNGENLTPAETEKPSETEENIVPETPAISDKSEDRTVSFVPAEGVHGGYSEDMIDEALAEGRKVVYLTFDDGPSHNTNAILDILAEYNVKATFFTIGREEEEFTDEYQRILEEGHSLGMHSFSHQYNAIYKTVEAFDEDFQKISGLIEEITGQTVTLYRFPGGSSNLVSAIPMTNFIKYLNDKGVTYFDWNVSAQDAEGKELPVDTILENIFKDIEKKDICVVLMHDADHLNTTVEALPVIIERLIEMDAVILPITENTTLIQHIKAEDVQ